MEGVDKNKKIFVNIIRTLNDPKIRASMKNFTSLIANLPLGIVNKYIYARPEQVDMALTELSDTDAISYLTQLGSGLTEEAVKNYPSVEFGRALDIETRQWILPEIVPTEIDAISTAFLGAVCTPAVALKIPAALADKFTVDFLRALDAETKQALKPEFVQNLTGELLQAYYIAGGNTKKMLVNIIHTLNDPKIRASMIHYSLIIQKFDNLLLNKYILPTPAQIDFALREMYETAAIEYLVQLLSTLSESSAFLSTEFCRTLDVEVRQTFLPEFREEYVPIISNSFWGAVCTPAVAKQIPSALASSFAMDFIGALSAETKLALTPEFVQNLKGELRQAYVEVVIEDTKKDFDTLSAISYSVLGLALIVLGLAFIAVWIARKKK